MAPAAEIWRRLAGQSAAVEREQSEVLAEGAVGVVEGENPVFDFRGKDALARFRRAAADARRRPAPRARPGFECSVQFARVDFGRAEFAGGDVDVGESGARAVTADGRQVVVFVRAEQVRIGGGAGGHNTGDFAFDQLLAGAGFLHLVADGDAITFVDQPRDVTFGGMIRNAAHGDCGPFSLLREVRVISSSRAAVTASSKKSS